jgi:TorA maturation chaperone TorD
MQDPQVLSAQAGLCDLLGRLLLSAPDAELAQLLKTEAVGAALEALEPGIGGWLPGFDAGTPAFEEAREDYATLFLRPGGVSPRAEAWLAGTGGGGVSVSRSAADGIRAALRRLGVVPADTSALGRLPPDHLALLLAAAAHGLRNAGSADQRAADALLSEFFDPYATAFGRKLQARASTPLYRAAGALVMELAAQRDEATTEP